MTNRLLKQLFVVCALALFATTAFAEDETDGRVSRVAMEISNEVYSPFCPGKTLAMCPSPAAAEVRRDIQKMARTGKTKDEIKETLFTEYGDEYRLVEPPGADNVLLGGLIGGGFFLAGIAVFFVSRRKDKGENKVEKQPETNEADGSEQEGDDYLDDLRGQYRD